jgi:hypothetical protein
MDEDSKVIVLFKFGNNLSLIDFADQVVVAQYLEWCKTNLGKYEVVAIYERVPHPPFPDEKIAQATLRTIKAYVDQEYFKMRKKVEVTPWYYPINKLAAEQSYLFIHIVRELIKKAEVK